MQIDQLTTGSLRELHEAIWDALNSDDAQPREKRAYGVRAYPDWRRQGDQYEAALAARGERFAPIPW
jgi:hypothetical protein